MNGKIMEKLQSILFSIDGKGYKAYKQLKGKYSFQEFTLYVDHVQGDPFAAPSKIRIRIPWEKTHFPEHCLKNKERQLGFEDFIIRVVANNIRKYGKGIRGTGKSGIIFIDVGGQEILKRSAMISNEQYVELRMEIGLPARGRTISGKVAESLFFKELPQIIKNSLFANHINLEQLKFHVDYVENFYFIQRYITDRNAIAFIADQSILPRESGISEKPLSRSTAIPFRTPKELNHSIPLKNPIKDQTVISGMLLPFGITLIVGGGFHGKSTLLEAIQNGIVPHIPGDGREYVVTHPDAVKIKAEDGRRIEKVNISPFVNHLPGNKDAFQFSTEDASGSTSQAANIIEALEVGAKVLLIDEDTSATNFMVRDARMQALVHKEQEPITPFIDRIKELKENFAVSTLLVMGGSGDYLDVADVVIQMQEYEPYVITDQAKQIARTYNTHRKVEREFTWTTLFHRIPDLNSINPSKGRKEVKIDAKGIHHIQFGKQIIDLQHVEQIFDESQTRAIGFALLLLKQKFNSGDVPLSDVLKSLEKYLMKKGLDILNPFHSKEAHPGNFAMPRRFEIAAALNRLRSFQVKDIL